MSMAAEQIQTCTTLDRLLADYVEAPAIPVTDITLDSRAVQPGTLFIAVKGFTHHGLKFVDDAVNRGAVAIAYDADTGEPARLQANIPVLAIAGLDGKVGAISNRFFGFPSGDLNVIGVTGTNGKTTVAWMIARCLAWLGHRCAYAGTLGYGLDQLRQDNDMTSPDVVTTQRRLAGFRDQSADFAAIEVSSHALDQARIDGTRFKAVLFTNLSRDHLDYHGDMPAYAAAKKRLFTDYATRQRVINVDSAFGEQLAAEFPVDTVVVSSSATVRSAWQSFVTVTSIRPTRTGSSIDLHTSWGDAQFMLPIPGRFNVSNAVTVLGYLLADGVELDRACAALAEVSAPPGRMQRVPGSQGPEVYVDYAHTPDALQVALTALGEHGRGKRWCVFGCGGERDQGKRAEMARIAERLADGIVLTNDNPRSENPQAIIADIASGFSAAAEFTVIEDRAAAIAWAISQAGIGDSVLIAGKGHENYQIIGAERRSFSDLLVAAANLGARS